MAIDQLPSARPLTGVSNRYTMEDMYGNIPSALSALLSVWIGVPLLRVRANAVTGLQHALSSILYDKTFGRLRN